MAGSNGMMRVPTGIAGLDPIMHGGLPVGAVFIVQGPPGAGKTIFANQICFNHAERGERAVYITLLAESHDRLLKHLGSMAFFRSDAYPSSIYYVSGFDKLARDGLNGILGFLAGEAKARQASLLVVDGLFVVEESSKSNREFRKFVNDVANLANLIGCTILLLTNSSRDSSSPEYTMVDGWIELTAPMKEYRAYRTLMVHKMRGSDFISGRHIFTISGAGITVLPRFETMEGCVPGPDVAERRLSTGVPDLDTMMDGGLPCGSATLMLGPTGVGKTSLGLHFLSRCTAAEPGLIFGFYETFERLRRRARNYGIDLDALVATGALEMIWHPPTENLLDQLGYELLQAVRARKVARLFVDGIDAFSQSIIFQSRLPPFLTALSSTLRTDGVTTFYTMELPFLMGGEHRVSLGSISAVAENILLLRYAEREGRLQRTLSLVKVRESDFDPAVREFRITPQGVRIGDPILGSVTDQMGPASVVPDSE